LEIPPVGNHSGPSPAFGYKMQRIQCHGKRLAGYLFAPWFGQAPAWCLPTRRSNSCFRVRSSAGSVLL